MMTLFYNLFSLDLIQILVGGSLLFFTLTTYFRYQSAVRSVQNHPGLRSLFSAHGHAGNIIPRFPGILGRHWGLRLKHTLFAKRGWDVISVVSILPRVAVGVIVADPLAIKEISTSRSRFVKPVDLYDILRFFGKNIVVTEGDEWKAHRKIAAPAFSQKNINLVWDEAIRITLDMMDSWGTNNEKVTIDNATNITMPLALHVICAAGFGRPIPWKEDTHVPDGHKLQFKEAIHIVSSCLPVKLITPRWLYPFSKFLTSVKVAFEELDVYMQEMMDERRSSAVREERNDLFTALLDASEDERRGIKLEDQELKGNIFIFLFAGHETTAHTMAFFLGLLALYQDEQEKLYQQIASVLQDDDVPTYTQMDSLTYVLAAINETLRLFPPVANIPKRCLEDTTVPVVQPDGTKGRIPIPKGAEIILNATGLHYNPRYWPDPERFDPSRFLGDWPRNAFLPFSTGTRSCMGRRFFEAESVAILTMILSRYRVELKDPELYEGLSDMERRAKLLACNTFITVTPCKIPLIFKRR